MHIDTDKQTPPLTNFSQKFVHFQNNFSVINFFHASHSILFQGKRLLHWPKPCRQSCVLWQQATCLVPWSASHLIFVSITSLRPAAVYNCLLPHSPWNNSAELVEVCLCHVVLEFDVGLKNSVIFIIFFIHVKSHWKATEIGSKTWQNFSTRKVCVRSISQNSLHKNCVITHWFFDQLKRKNLSQNNRLLP